MTTREYLKTRAIRFYRVPFGLLILPGVIYWRNNVLLEGLSVIAICLYLGAFIIFMRRTPCLRCSAPLLNVGLNFGSRRLPTPRCTNCGLGIDEPLTDQTNSDLSGDER